MGQKQSRQKPASGSEGAAPPTGRARAPTVTKSIVFDTNEQADPVSSDHVYEYSPVRPTIKSGPISSASPYTPTTGGGISRGRAGSKYTHVLPGDYSELESDTPKLQVQGMSRLSTTEWRTIRRRARRPSKEVSGDVAQLLDSAARESPWYLLAFDRDSILALMETKAQLLGPGAFALLTSGQDFATLCYLDTQLRPVNVPVVNRAGLLALSITNVKGETPTFASLSSLVAAYARRKDKQLGVALNPAALLRDEVLTALAQPKSHAVQEDIYDNQANPLAPTGRAINAAGPAYDLGRAPATPVYDVGTADRTDNAATNYDLARAGDHAPGVAAYDMARHPTSTPAKITYEIPVELSMSQYETVTAEEEAEQEDLDGLAEAKAGPGDEGFISISSQSFGEEGPIRGVSFQPCQTDQWFFVGLSNVQRNFHGKRDQHYDDIDFCLFFMGSGRVTAREAEDEVGPYVNYQPSDVLGIVTRYDKRARAFKVVYTHNNTVFYESTRHVVFPLHVDQAFPPESLNNRLVTNVKFISSS
ncbi:uncharacterized protein MONBRDRAFT_26427 [Monosiga brevicollis MX1]|uniref:Uncharacterized protein n=1 Tax=Monosiga brevicollis TaxID=81824 RepID=A9V2C2_MONBE|nr:uncharacterized protein MONBRDRAFT_26427 [Monosiga brevicollis MX1]EDQ88350.1 predicted protein [Monosiga brevicollis MX1]|eukprot:XP_001746943.1 hypothetical protein [Monosiga brevicollis MX1]